jgi:hypothetical protein
LNLDTLSGVHAHPPRKNIRRAVDQIAFISSASFHLL